LNFRGILLKILKPNSLSLQRIEWVKKKLSSLEIGSNLIDIGAGEKYFKKYCSNLNYTSQDICQYNGSGNEGLHMGTWDTKDTDIISDAANIPVEDETFDNALCTEVLEHAAHPIEILKEIFRILKPGGLAIITVPSLSLTHFAPHFYQAGFSKYFFKYHAQEIGFNILELKTIGGAFDLIFAISTSIRPAIKSNKGIKKYLLTIGNMLILLISGIFRLTLGLNFAKDISPMGTFVLLKKIE